MDIKKLIGIVESSKAFQELKDKQVLAHILLMSGTTDVGYYLPEQEKIVSYGIVEGKVEQKGISEIFKHPDQKGILTLDMDTVSITPDQAIQITIELQEKEYATVKPLKRIVLLQHVDEGQCYNITGITANFMTLNIKVDAQSGEIIAHKLVNLINS